MKHLHITLLGKESLPVFVPIQQLKPDIVYIIGTKETTDVAKRLKQALAVIGCECIIKATEAYDIMSTIKICEDIHTNLGAGCSYSYNVTGGTKVMAIGAFIVANQHGSKVIYTDSKNCLDLNTFESTPLDVNIGDEAIFILQGQRLKQYDIYSKDAVKSECSADIEAFIRCHIKPYSTIMDVYNSRKQLPNPFIKWPVRYEKHGSQITVENNDIEVLSIDHKDSFKLLFEGRWWETLVADAVASWSGGLFEVWQNVKFEPTNKPAGNKAPDKNEVDILVNVGNSFIFVECKSGAVTQDNIYKLAAIRQTYGSDKSKSVLVSYRKLNDELMEKAKENKISVIAPTNKYHSTLEQIPRKLDEILSSLKA